jgi:hypothetical protein
MDLVRDFVAGVIEAMGGVADQVADGVLALLPPAEATRLGVADEVRIKLDPSEQGEGTVDGRLGSPLLERLVAARLAAPAVAAVSLPPELPRPLPERLPVLLNAVRAGDVRSERSPARYLAVDLRLSLQGDEVRSTIESLFVRLEDAARVPPIRLDAGYPLAAVPLDEREHGRVDRALRDWLRREAPGRLAGALESVSRRARRDLERLAECYAGLDADMRQAAKRARKAEERERRTAKRLALREDLEARRAQLCERLKPRLSAALIAATLVETDVERFRVGVCRRARDGFINVLCRSCDSVFEGPVCAGCGVATMRFFLCDERLHVLCEQCGQAGRLDPSRCAGCNPKPPQPSGLTVDDPTRRLRLGE